MSHNGVCDYNTPHAPAGAEQELMASRRAHTSHSHTHTTGTTTTTTTLTLSLSHVTTYVFFFECTYLYALSVRCGYTTASVATLLSPSPSPPAHRSHGLLRDCDPVEKARLLERLVSQLTLNSSIAGVNCASDDASSHESMSSSESLLRCASSSFSRRYTRTCANVCRATGERATGERAWR